MQLSHRTLIVKFLFFVLLIMAGNGKTVLGQVAPDTVTWYDEARQRKIPVALYQPADNAGNRRKQLVIFSHGYGQNKGGDYLLYSYLNAQLAANGYFVVSIQHELPTDALIPMEGKPQVVRRPFWERGADNILFVINDLRKRNYNIDFKHITFMGHSNGGDITALFPQKYPGKAYRIITLDNRRMALPLQNHVYSLRSTDQPADEGVLPSDEEQKKHGMMISRLPATNHNDMDDDASPGQRKEIIDYIIRFLKK